MCDQGVYGSRYLRVVGVITIDVMHLVIRYNDRILSSD